MRLLKRYCSFEDVDSNSSHHSEDGPEDAIVDMNERHQEELDEKFEEIERAMKVDEGDEENTV
ncbi:hypothetical protein K440DRAFT_626187 [Wilcoxina mikolae CBS 423.85]|nr:hypothetical protein K440DRAFT_626187 [Wilcoxina mikolae CBS 423.85]